MKRKNRGFSLVEILVAIIAISCIMTALAPVITKKLKSNAVTVGAGGGTNYVEFVMDCSAWGDECALCTEDKCSLCIRDCNDDEFVFTQDCICKNCSEVASDCIECSAKKCKKCKGGYGLVNNKCEKCSAGTYSDGTSECLKAPKGTYVANDGANEPTQCQVGTYQDEVGKTSCKTCSSGTYQNETGKISCKTCEIDYMCTGGNNKTQCALNYGADTGSSSCSPCPSYCADCQVPNNCLKCNDGFYLASGTCYPCTVGYSCNGTATQTACPAGYYSGAGASSCSACPAGSYSNGGVENCTACSSGSYSASGAGSCTQCSTTWANCTTCTADGCSACKTDYELENGECIETNWCKGSNLMVIGDLCVTKYNMGDGGLPLNYSTGKCYTGIAGSCTDLYTAYSGCYRTLCNWAAATSACTNATIASKTGWRLPTRAEASNWNQYSDYLNENGLMLCSNNYVNYANTCERTYGQCSGSWSDDCVPSHIWTNEKEGSSNAYFMGMQGGWGSGYDFDYYAFSVRCVRSLD